MEPPKIGKIELAALDTYDFYMKQCLTCEIRIETETNEEKAVELRNQLKTGKLNLMAARSQLENRLCAEIPKIRKAPRAKR